jgi:hypothetical protein
LCLCFFCHVTDNQTTHVSHPKISNFGLCIGNTK